MELSGCCTEINLLSEVMPRAAIIIIYHVIAQFVKLTFPMKDAILLLNDINCKNSADFSFSVTD